MAMKFSALLIFLLFSNVFSEQNISRENNKNEILEEWQELDKKLADGVRSVIEMIMPQMMDSINEINVTSKCVQQSMKLILGVRKMKLWAFKFIDSSTKSMDGIITGTTSSFGVYKQCLESEAPSRNPKKPAFVGQYCQVDIRPPLPPQARYYKLGEKVPELVNFTGSEILEFIADKVGLVYEFPFKIGLCMPSGCNSHEIEQILNIMLKKIHLKANVQYCDIKEDTKYSELSIFIISFCSFISLIVIIGTACEIILTKKQIPTKNMACKIFMCFSLISNFKILSSTKSTRNNLQFLDGMKFLTIVFLILCHGFLYPFFMMHMYKSLIFVYNMIRDPGSQILISLHVTFDTLFFFSGFLVSYMSVKNVKLEHGQFSIIKTFCYKMWRLIPVYYFLILVTLLIPLMGSGPGYRDAMNFLVDNCYQNWWTNLLFINNFYKVDNFCMFQTWVIACDVQLFLVALIVLSIMIKSPNVGIGINILIILSTVAYNGTMTFLYHLIPGLYVEYLGQGAVSQSLLETFTTPLAHASSYFIGVLLGYKLVMNPDIKMSKKVQIAGWLFTILAVIYTLFTTSRWKHSDPSVLETTIYEGLYRTTWTMEIAWVTFCCATQHGGFINTFLSWKAWVPLSKLCFITYIIQPTLQIMYMAVFQTTHDFDYLELLVVFFGLLCMSILLATVVNLAVQSPLIAIEKTFFRTENSDSKNAEKFEISDYKTKM